MVITLQISATPELLGALNQLTGALMGKMPSVPAVTAPAEPTSKKSAPAPDSPKSEEPTATAPAPAEAPTIHEPATATASTLSLDDVKRIIMQKNKEGHREEIIAILKGHGFTSVPSISPNKFAEVFTQVSAL